jgi:hypothetical protein
VGVLEPPDEVARELRRAPEVDFLHASLARPDLGPRSELRVGA